METDFTYTEFRNVGMGNLAMNLELASQSLYGNAQLDTSAPMGVAIYNNRFMADFFEGSQLWVRDAYDSSGVGDAFAFYPASTLWLFSQGSAPAEDRVSFRARDYIDGPGGIKGEIKYLLAFFNHEGLPHVAASVSGSSRGGYANPGGKFYGTVSHIDAADKSWDRDIQTAVFEAVPKISNFFRKVKDNRPRERFIFSIEDTVEE